MLFGTAGLLRWLLVRNRAMQSDTALVAADCNTARSPSICLFTTLPLHLPDRETAYRRPGFAAATTASTWARQRRYSRATAAERRKLRDAIRDDLEMEKDDDAFPMKPKKILWEVRQHLGPDDIVLSDVGAHKMWIARYYQCETANTCLISNGFCSMGFALPGAMGAKLAHPDRRVLAIAGDAGFLMNVQDLETLVRYRQNAVIMIWVDGAYGLIKWKQQNHFGGRHSDLSFANPDFELLARSTHGITLHP